MLIKLGGKAYPLTVPCITPMALKASFPPTLPVVNISIHQLQPLLPRHISCFILSDSPNKKQPLHLLRCHCLCSSTTPIAGPTHLLEKYLVDSLGFSNQEAASISSKVNSRKKFKNPDSIIFLKQTGFDNTQLKKMVSKVPNLLFRTVTKNIKPKFQCLIDLGLSQADLISVITRNTAIVDRSLDTHLRPTIDSLRRIFGSDDNVVKAIKRSPWLLTFGAHHHITETNILLLKNSGVPDDRIIKMLLRIPSSFAQNPESIKGLLDRVENDFGVPCDSPMFQHGFQVLNGQKKFMLDRKIGIFKSFGWSDDEILDMFRKQPYCVSLSEVRIQKTLNLFMKELGLEPAYLASHPSILMYSLEKRVVPRMQVLKILDEKKLERRKLGLCTVMNLTEEKFIDYFVLPYKDKAPDLYEQLKEIVAP
ncbi:transcription termination factor MTERF5, chloroplastic [Capsicum chacoense]|uniref:Uncharacterized protein n=1 Tax=Capsicum annuum TaxID=4072 RepID=A0A1U8GDF6_CAPAN|nr:transcription termination factor MTERF5, chloroplastic [Capsicum annuum]KAF3625113.1 putative protein EPIDERMAL PATTERNING FACTOR 2-like [Capsicum annuum]KAF3652108.1 putative protein EPIDERMAL PATTERNING FACTOR 2-like [Capsicum annuum]PHT84129.1 hypothetical protein T459_12572 [Capsicum annuum]